MNPRLKLRDYNIFDEMRKLPHPAMEHEAPVGIFVHFAAVLRIQSKTMLMNQLIGAFQQLRQCSTTLSSPFVASPLLILKPLTQFRARLLLPCFVCR